MGKLQAEENQDVLYLFFDIVVWSLNFVSAFAELRAGKLVGTYPALAQRTVIVHRDVALDLAYVADVAVPRFNKLKVRINVRLTSGTAQGLVLELDPRQIAFEVRRLTKWLNHNTLGWV